VVERLAYRFWDLQVAGSNPGGATVSTYSKSLTRIYQGQLSLFKVDKLAPATAGVEGKTLIYDCSPDPYPVTDEHQLGKINYVGKVYI